MKTKEKRNTQKNKATGMRISVAIHLVLLVLALIPLISSGEVGKNEAVMIIPVDFRAVEGHPDKSLRAQALQQAPVLQPVADERAQIDRPVAKEEVAEEPETEANEMIDHEVVNENLEEVTASQAEDKSVENKENATKGGVHEAAEKGDARGGDTSGKDAWKAGLEGDGILTRRIVHREDITQVAEQDGVIAVNVCVNRAGKVSAAKYNEVHTTIRDKELIRKALYVVTGYRFEMDMAAPEKECGMLTFIFDVDWDNSGGQVATID